jgi:hypothetical protein
MAKDKHKDKEAGVYRIVDVIGVSASSWEDAATRAVETAAKSLSADSHAPWLYRKPKTPAKPSPPA